ncbi:MAG: TMEM14 family protein [Chthoniobacterales bacterium]
MFSPTKIYFIVFGLLTIAGGAMGYVKAGSTASLIAGSISGILLVAAAFLLPGHVLAGLALGGIVSLLLAARFLPAFFRSGKMMPDGMMALLSILGVVFAIAAWIRK